MDKNMKEQVINAIDESSEKVMKLKKENIKIFDEMKAKIEEIKANQIL